MTDNDSSKTKIILHHKKARWGVRVGWLVGWFYGISTLVSIFNIEVWLLFRAVK